MRAPSFEEAWRIIKELNFNLFENFGYQVLTGPFAGMLIRKHTKWNDGNQGVKLIGAYEFELHKIIEKIIKREPDTVVNVGCADGYYAIGMGMRLPKSKIYAMDIDNDSLDLCEHNANINNVKRLTTVVGKPAPQDLKLGSGRRLFFVDVEGDELALLNKDLCPLLIDSDIIVECHDFWDVNNPISAKLKERFSDSHDVEVIVPDIPYPGDYPFLSDMPIGTVLLAITERRPMPTVWLACWTQQKGNLNG